MNFKVKALVETLDKKSALSKFLIISMHGNFKFLCGWEPNLQREHGTAQDKNLTFTTAKDDYKT